MRLYQQLVLFLLAATVLPLAGVGFWLLGDAQRALAERIASEQRAVVSAAAERTSAQLLETVDAIARAAGLIDWAHASQDERRGGLSLLYQQSPRVAAAMLVDAQGAPLGEAVFDPHAADHPGFESTDLEALRQALPVNALKRGAPGQAAISRVYRSRSRGGPAMALAVKLGAGDQAPFALIELGLDSLEGLLRQAAAPGQRIELVDGQGTVVASSEAGRTSHTLEPALARVARTGGARAQSFSVAGPPRWIGAVAGTPAPLNFVALVEADPDVALAPVLRMRREVAAGLGASLLVLLAAGFLFTRRVTKRLSAVVEGAEAFARGELETRIELGGADELTELSQTFNRMGEELHGARARLLRWNDDLKQRVDEATAELRAAQAQLVEAQKLAAVGQLGAGVAHEINNPLAGILGHTQLLLLDREPTDGDFEALRKIELSAKRCKEITQNLLRFSQQREKAELRPIDLNAVARDALALTEHQLQGEGISLELSLADAPLRVSGDPGHLAQVVLALIGNARTAMAKAPRKALRLTSRTAPDGRAELTVEDTGKGIAPEHLPRIFEPFFTTKDVWSNVGLGLSVAYRVVSEHEGRLEVATEVGKGSRFTLSLPLLADRAGVKDAAAAARAPAA
jgi:signal transduction histidine kinase